VNKIKQKFILFLLIPSVSVFSMSTVFAADDICTNNGVVFASFNGVQTTEAQARINLLYLKVIHGRTSPKGDNIQYEYLYNYTEGFEDFVETFEQRLKEQDSIVSNKFELFFDALNGGNGSWWRNLTTAAVAYKEVLQSVIDQIQAQKINNLTTLLANPPTIQNYAEQKGRILEWTQQGKKLVFVAHSQGNLFANAAYDYALTQVTSKSVKVIHIAPASPKLNGTHVLADKDLVINGLRVAGTVARITDTIPGYLVRPAGLNFLEDILGHGLLEIYLNPHLTTSTKVKAYINDALSTVEAPEKKVSDGFFTATLSWNGSGDVDLHTFEPSGGAHVYYQSPTGNSGFLDQDNTTNGTVDPEHYYASCDASKLKLGTYRVAVANYAGATGRTATVQIASANGGVLGTKNVTLGRETGDTPIYSLFNVVVGKNAQTGAYEVSLN